MKEQNNFEYLGLSQEMAKAQFGDVRLSKRLGKIVEKISKASDLSFPEALGSSSELEGFYRFLRNSKIDVFGILEPHFEATISRIGIAREILVVHDTTEFKFSGQQQRKDLGWVKATKKQGIQEQGFFGHFALAVCAQTEQALGVLGYESINRTHSPIGTRRTHYQQTRKRNKESDRWLRQIDEVESRLNNGQAIHVLDREGDMYALLSQMQQQGRRFVIRVSHNRKLDDSEDIKENLFSIVESSKSLCTREVFLNERKAVSKSKKTIGRHPARNSRMAELSLSSTKVVLQKPNRVSGDYPEIMKLNVVRVWEEGPPDNEPAVEWKLFTSEEVDTPEQLEKVVDIYRNRWQIEEYFKVLKTGCKYESRQLESYQTLENGLAILAPVAWRIFRLKQLSRSNPNAPAQVLFTPTQLKILRNQYKGHIPDDLTLDSAINALASIAGHHKSNGPPGWQILWRGYRQILILESFWLSIQSEKM